jgi:hypothetical protein
MLSHNCSIFISFIFENGIISKATEKDRYAVVIMDRAAWHTTGKIKCFDNIIPMPLPPYAPERYKRIQIVADELLLVCYLWVPTF